MKVLRLHKRCILQNVPSGQPLTPGLRVGGLPRVDCLERCFQSPVPKAAVGKAFDVKVDTFDCEGGLSHLLLRQNLAAALGTPSSDDKFGGARKGK